MNEAALEQELALAETQERIGHPSGLRVLFLTEMWERFSYYGMRALLILYMTSPAAQGGLGFGLRKAALIYGIYTFSVYAAGIPGGWVADRYLGLRRTILIGGGVLALGHFALIFSPQPFFYGGLLLIILGTGMLKSNCATLVGLLYEKDDPRRDAGFSIYYMGMNLGGMMAPFVCGFLAQSSLFLGWLQRWGLATHSGWHWGFGAAGVAMILGLIQFSLHQHRFGEVGLRPRAEAGQPGKAAASEPLSPEEKGRLRVVAILFIFATLFWAIYEQAGSTLNLFANRFTDCRLGGWSFPSTWYQGVPSLFVIALAPVLAWFWARMGERNPSSPGKLATGVFLVGLGTVLLLPSALRIDQQPGTLANPGWLVGVYFLHVVGELCLSPVGLSLISKLAPLRMGGLVMGVWYLTNAFGNLLAGLAAGLFSTMSLSKAFGLIFIITTLAAGLLALLLPGLKRLMGEVR